MNTEVSILNPDAIIAIEPWAGDCTTLSFSFLICKVVTIRGILFHRVAVRINEYT